MYSFESAKTETCHTNLHNHQQYKQESNEKDDNNSKQFLYYSFAIARGNDVLATSSNLNICMYFVVVVVVLSYLFRLQPSTRSALHALAVCCQLKVISSATNLCYGERKMRKKRNTPKLEQIVSRVCMKFS